MLLVDGVPEPELGGNVVIKPVQDWQSVAALRRRSQAKELDRGDPRQQEATCRELERELQVAADIQMSILPNVLPVHEAFDFGGRILPARQVGGDFYDVFNLGNNKFGVLIGDVADKGVPAALFMALTRTLVRAAVFENHSPAEAMKRVNDLLIPDTRQGMFVTAVYAVLDLQTGELTYVNAGHNPPLWVKVNGSIEKLTRTAIALGVVTGESVAQQTIQLEAGDSLLLYTDGLTESFNNEGAFYGEERLMEALLANQCVSANELMDVVEKSLLDFVRDVPPADDLTMLVLRRA